jgi:hypothetical protein
MSNNESGLQTKEEYALSFFPQRRVDAPSVYEVHIASAMPEHAVLNFRQLKQTACLSCNVALNVICFSTQSDNFFYFFQ